MLNVSHSRAAFENIEEIVFNAKGLLHDIKFDAFAFRGMSGALVAPILARELGKKMILVRKREDTSHSFLPVEGDIDAKRYIIVDDFIQYGGTVREIIERISHTMPKARCVGIALYQKRSVVSTFISEYMGIPVTLLG